MTSVRHTASVLTKSAPIDGERHLSYCARDTHGGGRELAKGLPKPYSLIVAAITVLIVGVR